MGRDIKKGLFAILQGDATLLALQGGDAADTRVHNYREPDASDFTKAVPTLVTVYQMTSGGGRFNEESGVEKPNEMYQVDIWGLDPDAVEQTAGRVYALLDQSAIPTGGTFEGNWCVMVAEGDQPAATAGGKSVVLNKVQRYHVKTILKSG